MKAKSTLAHVAALITVTVLGTTFIATKLLLDNFSPIEILVIRFVAGYIGLWLYELLIVRRKEGTSSLPVNWTQELLFAAAGATGVVMYYLLENIALTMTYASNVGILVSMAPLTTAVLALVFLRQEKVRPSLFVGFVIASVGAVLVMFNGAVEFRLSLKGDLLALCATLGWGIYSIILRKIDTRRYRASVYTRKIFFYGILIMVPVLFASERTMNLSSFGPLSIVLLLFLGFGASAACFVSWNYAVSVLGVFKTSAYIYLTPLISLVTAALVLAEQMTVMAVGGCVLILAGLFISERKAAVPT